MDKIVKCFKCDKDIILVEDCPDGGVVFTGGDGYGSTIYDSMVDGINVKLIICDDCIKDNSKNLEEFKIRKIPNEYIIMKEFGITKEREN